MPFKKRMRSAAVHDASPDPRPGLRLAGGDADLPPLPNSFHAAVQRLVDLVHATLDDNTTMFKLEMANVPDTQSVPAVVADLSTKTQQDLCTVRALCEVRPSDLPANGCSALYDQRQYAEALLHAIRAHFAFVELDRRLIYTSTAGVRDPTAASQLLYVFSYVKSTSGRAESASVRTAGRVADARGATNRRRTVAVLPRAEQGNGVGESSIGDELERYRDRLDRVERSLLETSQSLAEEDLRLPDTALDSSLEAVPAPALGTALHAVLPRVQAAAAAADKRPTTTKKKPPRGMISHPDTAAAAATRATPATGRRGKRRHSLSPAPAAMDTTDSTPAPTEPAPAAGPPTPSRQSAAHLPPAEADQLLAFFQKLNTSQTEQSRVSLTCRYAKMRYGHDVPSGAVYRLVETAGRQGAGRAAAGEPAPLTEQGRRETALAVFRELDPSHSEQSRVAYTLQYMRVQHSVRLDANTLFGWLGQGAKKPSAKKPSAKRARVR